MAKRREPRVEMTLPVRIFGTDSAGKIFSEKVSTVNVSRRGVELSGVQTQLNPEEIIGLTYKQCKSQFRVKWIGPAGTPKGGHVGLLNVSPEKNLWDFPLPEAAIDGVRDAHDRRQHPRSKTANSVEIYPHGQNAPIRTRTVDISLGGCFIEMPVPLAKGTELRIALWVKQTKLWADGKVVTIAPGFGNGLQFTVMSDQDKEQLAQFLGSIARFPN